MRARRDPADGRFFTGRHRRPPAGRCWSRLRTRKNAYLARRLRELDQDEVATLERAAEILEGLLEGERR